ncbi:hypothetical protein [Cohnella sp. GbtcB17]|uniref:hypothetical protein n=1 Tax=Cohnella sp. GbtcB17 TaxID=2824762 RepID=UPI001C30B363|nr:hypothetical protein [Cohnella sp. GbtcB17]
MRKRQRKKIRNRASRKILNGQELTYAETRIIIQEIARCMRKVYQVVNSAAKRMVIGWKASYEQIRYELERKTLGVDKEGEDGRENSADLGRGTN